jgi:hypothetical protein
VRFTARDTPVDSLVDRDDIVDRRDALKKLAGGGIAAVAATAVTSSPAFAFTGPTPPALPILTPALTGPIALGSRTLTVTMGPGTATCPGSATPPGPTVVGSSFTAIGPSAGNGLVSVSPLAGSTAGPGSLAVSFERDTFSFFGFTIGAAATATFTYRVRYRCSYARPGQADTCRSWTVVYSAASFGNWSTTPSLTVGSACP